MLTHMLSLAIAAIVLQTFLQNSPPMKIGVGSPLREGHLSYCKETAHPVWLASLVIHTLLKE